MPLNAQLLNALRAIHDATIAVEGGYAFANPKNPAIKSLEKDGFLTSNPAVINPADAAQIAYRSTDKAAAEFPPPVASVAGSWPAGADAAGSAPVGVGNTPPPPTEAAAPPAARRGRPPGPRGPNPVKPAPIIARSGARLAALPVVASAGRRGPREEKYPFSSLEAPLPVAPDGSGGFDSFFVHATESMPAPHKALGSNVNKANKKWPTAPDKRVFKIYFVEKDHEYGVAGARVARVE